MGGQGSAALGMLNKPLLGQSRQNSGAKTTAACSGCTSVAASLRCKQRGATVIHHKLGRGVCGCWDLVGSSCLAPAGC